MIGDRGGANEGDRPHIRMLEQRIDRDLVALYDVENAIRKPGLFHQVGVQQRRRGIGWRRLQYEGIARGDGDGKHPHRYHDWEIERRNSGDDPERLTHRPVVDARRYLVAEIAFQQLRHATSEFHHVDAAFDLTAGIAQDLAMLRRDRARQVFLVIIQESEEAVHQTRPPYRRHLRPGGKRCSGGRDRRTHFRSGRQRDTSGNLSGRRIEHVG